MTDTVITQELIDNIITNGPTRVVINGDGHADASTVGQACDIVFVRNDGWSLGASVALADTAFDLWVGEYVGFIARVDIECSYTRRLRPMRAYGVWKRVELMRAASMPGVLFDALAENADLRRRVARARDEAVELMNAAKHVVWSHAVWRDGVQYVNDREYLDVVAQLDKAFMEARESCKQDD